MKKCIPNTRRSKVHDANAKISTTIWLSSSTTKRIHPTRFLGAWTSFSTINDDVIQPSRKLPLEVSDPNLSSFIIVYLILVCHTRSMVGTLTLDLYAFFVCAYMCLKVEQYKN